MKNGPKTNLSARLPRPRPLSGAHPKRRTSTQVRSEPKGSQNAHRNYERYLALARAEVLIGNTVGAENYYQHAEHYYRSMCSGAELK